MMKRRKRRVWVRPIFGQRQQQGDFHNLLQEMRLCDPNSHFRYIRMSKERFDSLLAEVRCRKYYYSEFLTFKILLLGQSFVGPPPLW